MTADPQGSRGDGASAFDDVVIDVEPVERCRRGLEACGIEEGLESQELALESVTPLGDGLGDRDASALLRHETEPPAEARA